nr:reverse transcriptase domain-containing protein [Tanacetum cinerariifolium]
MPDFGGNSLGYAVQGSSRGAGFDDEDMDDKTSTFGHIHVVWIDPREKELIGRRETRKREGYIARRGLCRPTGRIATWMGAGHDCRSAEGENRASWSDKLDDALWAFRTTYKTPIGCTPYKLVYGKACHLPVELEHKAYWALKHANFEFKTTGDHRKDWASRVTVLVKFSIKSSVTNKVVNESLPAELARYKEQVEIHKKRQAEVEQHAVDKKCAKIGRKNLLIESENLLADCLLNELLYSATNAVNIVSRFSKMHAAYTVEQARNVELDVEISRLKHKIQKDDHSDMIKHFSNLEGQVMHSNVSELLSKSRGILGRAWYWRMKILRSVLFRKERMAGPKENRFKVVEKDETGKFRGSPDGGPVNLWRSHIY